MPDIREAAIASIPASAGREPRFDLHTPVTIPGAHHARQRALPTGNYDQVNLALASRWEVREKSERSHSLATGPLRLQRSRGMHDGRGGGGK
jgi:hypothetical protein